MSSQTKIAVVGGGRWGINHIRSLYKASLLGAVVEASAPRRLELQKEFTGTAILSSLQELTLQMAQGAVVATPVQTHFEVANILLDKKFSILVEKPTTPSYAETLKLVEKARQQKLTIMTGFLLLYQPAIEKVKQIISEGLLGEIKSMSFSRLNFGKARNVEDAFWSLGVHDVAVMTYLSDAEISSVKAQKQSQSFFTADVADQVYVDVGLKNGTQAHFHCSWNWPFKRRELVVIGTEGYLHFDENENKLHWHKKKFNQNLDNVDAGVETFDFSSVEPLRIEQEDFVKAIEKGLAPKAGPEVTLKVAQIFERLES